MTVLRSKTKFHPYLENLFQNLKLWELTQVLNHGEDRNGRKVQ